MDSRNNLRGMRTYLVGAMDRVPDGGVQWRDRVTKPLHDMNVKVINPCDKPVYSVKENDKTRDIIEEYKRTGQFDRLKNEFGVIRNADLRCVDISDFIIAQIDIDVHACGTYEEIVTANRQKKPVLVNCVQGKAKAPNWLFFMLPHTHIFSSMDELVEYLGVIDADHEPYRLKRWFFFEDSIIK